MGDNGQVQLLRMLARQPVRPSPLLLRGRRQHCGRVAAQRQLSELARHAARRHSGHPARRTLRLGGFAQTADGWRNFEDGNALPPPRANQQGQNHH